MRLAIAFVVHRRRRRNCIADREGDEEQGAIPKCHGDHAPKHHRWKLEMRDATDHKQGENESAKRAGHAPDHDLNLAPLIRRRQMTVTPHLGDHDQCGKAGPDQQEGPVRLIERG